MFKLVIQDDEGKTTVVPLSRDEITIGRKEGNTIRLTERNVSRRHARIFKSNDEVQIEDLGSYNGIRVNNARIAARASLRISDQVQIGDYKLFLKTESAEIDGARTVPMDRLHEGSVTEVLAAVTAGTAATQPVPTLHGIGPAEAKPPDDRSPVAAASGIPAVSEPARCGRLVVVSSNLAGKEFELTRPQMIIGRTDDNDLIVNHRSISRNHAKISRDPDTHRYLISDLQSANGVRVNNQDYAKVELRRGDIIDLGHVRLRFIEPGEDFVFGRDAVITDVPDEGGRRRLAVAVAMAMMVLGAAGGLVWFKTQERSENIAANSVPPIGSDAVGSNAPVVQPIFEDAGETGSAEVDAGSADPVDKVSEAKRIVSECLGYETDAKWSDLTLCADKLAPLDPNAAAKFKAKVSLEIRANIQKDKMESELAAGSLMKAKGHLNAIPDDSIAKQPSQAEYDRAEQRVIDDFKNRAAKAKRAGKCADIEVLTTQASAQSSRVAAEVRALKCEAPPPLDCSDALKEPADKKCVKQYCATHDSEARCGGPPPCDFDALMKLGGDSAVNGNYKEALSQYEDALRCRYDSHTVGLAYMSACNAKNPVKARVYWKKLSAERQNAVAQICDRNQISRDLLDAP